VDAFFAPVLADAPEAFEGAFAVRDDAGFEVAARAVVLGLAAALGDLVDARGGDLAADFAGVAAARAVVFRGVFAFVAAAFAAGFAAFALGFGATFAAALETVPATALAAALTVDLAVLAFAFGAGLAAAFTGLFADVVPPFFVPLLVLLATRSLP
jgi:hypothetical protein